MFVVENIYCEFTFQLFKLCERSFLYLRQHVELEINIFYIRTWREGLNAQIPNAIVGELKNL